VGIIKALLRVYSCVFEGLLALFAMGISGVAISSHTPLNLAFLPLKGKELSYYLLISALFGLLTLLLAMAGKLRALFFLWSLAVFAVLFRGFFLTAYSFSGPVPFKPALYLTAGAFMGMIGAWPWARKPEGMRRPMRY
jgi:nicotinamide riboside transporter PnuC